MPPPPAAAPRRLLLRVSYELRVEDGDFQLGLELRQRKFFLWWMQRWRHNVVVANQHGVDRWVAARVFM
jgi:hypothetical protein